MDKHISPRFRFKGNAIIGFILAVSTVLLILLAIFELSRINWNRWQAQTELSKALKSFESNPNAYQPLFIAAEEGEYSLEEHWSELKTARAALTQEILDGLAASGNFNLDLDSLPTIRIKMRWEGIRFLRKKGLLYSFLTP